MRFVDVARPELGASLVLLLDGSEDVGPGEPGLDGPDSMTIDRRGNVLIQEDPNAKAHLARIIAYRIADGALGVVAEFESGLFGQGASTDPSGLTTEEESSGITDTEALLGPGTFLLNAQAPTAKALGAHRDELVQHGQLLVVGPLAQRRDLPGFEVGLGDDVAVHLDQDLLEDVGPEHDPGQHHAEYHDGRAEHALHMSMA